MFVLPKGTLIKLEGMELQLLSDMEVHGMAADREISMAIFNERAAAPYRQLDALGTKIRSATCSAREALASKMRLEALLIQRLESLQREIHSETQLEAMLQRQEKVAGGTQTATGPRIGQEVQLPQSESHVDSPQCSGAPKSTHPPSIEAALALVQALQFVLNQS
jgi:hypothetical protein